MTDSIHEMSRVLGEIQGTLIALARVVEKTSVNTEEQEDTLRAINLLLSAAAEERRFMRTEIKSLQAATDDMRVVTDDVKKWRTLGVGALTITGIGAAWLASNGVWLWGTLVSFFKQHS